MMTRRTSLLFLSLLSLLALSLVQVQSPCNAQGLRGMPPEDTPIWVWQDNLLAQEKSLKHKLEEIYRAPLKTLDPRYIPTLISLESVLDEEGKVDEHVRVLRQLLKAQKELHGPERTGIGDEIETMCRLGHAVETMGPSESEALFEEALSLALGDKELSGYSVYFCMIDLASARIRSKRFAEAERLCFQARDFAKRRKLDSADWEAKLLETYCKSKSYEKAKHLLNLPSQNNQVGTLLSLAKVQLDFGDAPGLLQTYRKYRQATRLRGNLWFAESLAACHFYDEAWQERRDLIAQKDLEHYMDDARKELKTVGRLARLPSMASSKAGLEKRYLIRWASTLAMRIQKQERVNALRGRNG